VKKMPQLRELLQEGKNRILSPRENPLVIGIVLMLLFPLVIHNAYYQHIMILVLMWGVAATGWNMLGGYGENSIGHAAYFGLGAYVSTLLFLRLDITPWIGLFVGAIFGGVTGVLIGAVAFRLRGSYYVLTTIAFAETLKEIFLLDSFCFTPLQLALVVLLAEGGIAALIYFRYWDRMTKTIRGIELKYILGAIMAFVVFMVFLALMLVEDINRATCPWGRKISGGGVGLLLPPPHLMPNALFNFSFPSKLGYYYTGLILLGVAIIVTYLLHNSKLGYQLTAIRENEEAAESLGINVTRCKLKAAGMSAFFAAMAGVFYMQYMLYITPTLTMGVMLSVQMVVISAVGGLGTVFGPFIGSLILIPLAELIRVLFGARAPGLHLAVYGIALILVVLLLPAGILPKLQEIYKRNVLKEDSGEGQD